MWPAVHAIDFSQSENKRGNNMDTTWAGSIAQKGHLGWSPTSPMEKTALKTFTGEKFCWEKQKDSQLKNSE